MTSYVLVLFLVTMFSKVTSDCDTSKPAVEEGNIGQSAAFSWLGILRVNLPGVNGDKPNVALTGLVLIKKKFALVSADDVVRIPEYIFNYAEARPIIVWGTGRSFCLNINSLFSETKPNEHTHAMFVQAPDTSWYCRPKSFRSHDEYELMTVNTIAVLELDLDVEAHIPLRPICWSRRMSLHSSLYLVGYTDDHDILEKVVHKMLFVENNTCDKFYEKSELAEEIRKPVHYLCASSISKSSCVWENGMVLVSNASEKFTLVGFAIRGPGCGAPARFIDLQRYYNWIETVTTSQEEESPEDYRRDNDIIDRISFNEYKETNAPKPHAIGHKKYRFDISRYFNVDEEDNQTLKVYRFDNDHESYANACSIAESLLYKEEFELKSKDDSYGVAYYKISLSDLLKNAFGCVRLSIHSIWHSAAILSYKQNFEISEGTPMTSSEETPDELKKHITQAFERTTWAPPSNRWKQSYKLKLEYVQDQRRKSRVLNYDLYVRFGFSGQAFLKVEMFSERLSRTTTQSPKRRFDFPVLTSAEERQEYLRYKRVKMTIPPTHKLWYERSQKNRTIRSGFVKEIPESISKYFGEVSGIAHENYDVDVNVKNINADVETEDEIETEKTYLKFIRNTDLDKDWSNRKRNTIEEDKDTSPSKIIPDFIVNTIRSISGAPKIAETHEIVPEIFPNSSSSLRSVRLSVTISFIIFVLIINL